MSAPSLGKYVGGRERLGPRGKDVLGEAISSTLQNLGTAAGQGFQSDLQKQKDASLLEQYNPELSPLQQIKLISNLSPNAQKSFLSTMMTQHRMNQQNQSRQKFIDDLEFKKNRNARLDIRDVHDQYKFALNELKYDIEKGRKDEREAAIPLRKNLKKEMEFNIARMRKGEKPIFKYLQSGNEEQVQQVAAPSPVAIAETPIGQKVKWDVTNPQHLARRAQILQEVGNDINLARAKLAEEFVP